ncbi:hypothetical protein [Dehalogenimonas etheniformans]|uniref:hypothetical protein n=1 Tax=Dehalogenimonas etheniformans TaxID=1536648 RepID=UPI00167FA1D4|nr:hypothetical protein [Dehalogenimonas etheniformans]QNT75516.1 hypothetical protein HX448_01860 [Dehalogenimonas etheniformans]
MRSGNSGNPCPDTQLYVSVVTVNKLGEPRKLARFDMAGGLGPPATLSYSSLRGRCTGEAISMPGEQYCF